MPMNAKSIISWLGSALAFIGVVYVGRRLYGYWGTISFSDISWVGWLLLIVCIVAYGVANILLALAWREFLIYFGAHVSRMWSIKIYGISQLAKYVPGNIFHFVGRQAIGTAYHIQVWALAKSSLWEIGVIAVVGLLLSLLALPVFVGVPVFLGLILTVCVLVAAACLIKKTLGVHVFYAFIFQLSFLVISSLIFVVIFLSQRASLSVPSVDFGFLIILLGAYVTAWLIGLVTPGAPAGVGVRELVMFFLLKGMVTEQELLFAVLLGRFVTVLGDVFFFVYAQGIPKKWIELEVRHDG